MDNGTRGPMSGPPHSTGNELPIRKTIMPTTTSKPTTSKHATSADLAKAIRTASDAIVAIAGHRRNASTAIAASVAARVGSGDVEAADTAAAAAVAAVGTAADEATAAIAVVAAMAGTRIASADAAAAKIDPETPGHKIASLLTASVNGTGKAGKAIVDTFRTPKG